MLVVGVNLVEVWKSGFGTVLVRDGFGMVLVRVFGEEKCGKTLILLRLWWCGFCVSTG